MDMTKAQLKQALDGLTEGKSVEELSTQLGVDLDLLWRTVTQFGFFKGKKFVNDVTPR